MRVLFIGDVMAEPGLRAVGLHLPDIRDRYDLVIAGMAIIGLIGLLLDGSMRLLEKHRLVRWRYAH